jgi:hypothetical protein
MSELVETAQLAFTNTADSYATFGLELSSTGKGHGVQKVVLRSTADCYVNFDEVANSTEAFKLFAADNQSTEFDFSGGSVMKIHAIGASGSGTLYIVGIRT